MFAIYELATGTWDGVPAPSDDHDEEHGARPIPAGWPELYAWSSSLPGFKPIVATSVQLTRLGYQRLYTQAERIAVRASSDPIVVDFRELAALAESIDLTDPDVIAGTGYLEYAGLIAAGRATEVLSGTPPA